MTTHYCLFYKENHWDSQVELKFCDCYESAKGEAERMIEAFKFWGGGPVPESVAATKWTKSGKYAGEAYPRIEYDKKLYIDYAREKGTKYGYYRFKKEESLCQTAL